MASLETGSRAFIGKWFKERLIITLEIFINELCISKLFSDQLITWTDNMTYDRWIILPQLILNNFEALIGKL